MVSSKLWQRWKYSHPKTLRSISRTFAIREQARRVRSWISNQTNNKDSKEKHRSLFCEPRVCTSSAITRLHSERQTSNPLSKVAKITPAQKTWKQTSPQTLQTFTKHYHTRQVSNKFKTSALTAPWVGTCSIVTCRTAPLLSWIMGSKWTMRVSTKSKTIDGLLTTKTSWLRACILSGTLKEWLTTNTLARGPTWWQTCPCSKRAGSASRVPESTASNNSWSHVARALPSLDARRVASNKSSQTNPNLNSSKHSKTRTDKLRNDDEKRTNHVSEMKVLDPIHILNIFIND